MNACPASACRSIARVSVVILVLASLSAPWPAGATLAGSNGKIAYNTQWGFWLANPDGSDPVRLLARSAWGGAQFSPDGTMIAFESYTTSRRGKQRMGVFVMGSDGSAIHRIAVSKWLASSLAWSPDGNWIAFEDAHWDTDTSGNEVIHSSIQVVHPDGTGLAALTGETERNCWPSWSPDSKRMVFAREADQTSAFIVMNADGTNKVQVSDGAHFDLDAAWSPTGDQIAFVRASDSRHTTALAVMASDGSGVTLLTDLGPSPNAPSPRHPTWSPDGKSIGYAVYQRGSTVLWTIGSDGTGARALTGAADQYVEGFEWSPDSSSIAFNAHGDLHVVSRGSGAITPLTNTANEEYLTDWQTLPL